MEMTNKVVTLLADGGRELITREPLLGLFLDIEPMEYRGYMVERRVEGQQSPTVGSLAIIAADLLGMRARTSNVIRASWDSEDGVVHQERTIETLHIDCGDDSGGCCGKCKRSVKIESTSILSPGNLEMTILFKTEQGSAPLVTIRYRPDEENPDVVLSYASTGNETELSVATSATDMASVLQLAMSFQADVIYSLLCQDTAISRKVLGED
jgi:hypothetical protein